MQFLSTGVHRLPASYPNAGFEATCEPGGAPYFYRFEEMSAAIYGVKVGEASRSGGQRRVVSGTIGGTKS